MSAHRRPEIRFSDAPRGTCRWCGDDILHLDGEKQGEVNLRRRWHPSCVDIYNATDPREARRRVRKRDRGRCAECKLDTNALRRKIRAMGRGRTQELCRLGFKPRKSLWELDHIVPLVDGGSHDLDNLQTLCTPCHIKKTAEEARLRAARAREELAALEAVQSARAAQAAPARDESDARTTKDPPAATRRKRPKRNLDELLEQADAANARAEALLARF
jgi:5-methylcytosine-specific restriction endonuclease McrA